jgi:hypothetical protein
MRAHPRDRGDDLTQVTQGTLVNKETSDRHLLVIMPTRRRDAETWCSLRRRNDHPQPGLRVPIRALVRSLRALLTDVTMSTGRTPRDAHSAAVASTAW